MNYLLKRYKADDKIAMVHFDIYSFNRRSFPITTYVRKYRGEASDAAPSTLKRFWKVPSWKAYIVQFVERFLSGDQSIDKLYQKVSATKQHRLPTYEKKIVNQFKRSPSILTTIRWYIRTNERRNHDDISRRMSISRLHQGLCVDDYTFIDSWPWFWHHGNVAKWSSLCSQIRLGRFEWHSFSWLYHGGQRLYYRQPYNITMS